MRRSHAAQPVGWLLFLCLATLCAAADLQERTSQAYDHYSEEITRKFLERVRAGDTPTAPRDGETSVRPGSQDGIIDVPGGLLHHWIGSSFIAGATLKDALDVSYAYERYHAIYEPVMASRLLSRDGNTYHVLLRLRESAGGLSAVLDVTARVEYVFPGNGRVYSVSVSDEIREIKDAGNAQERQLPAGRDSGYLWRAMTLNRFVEGNGGVFIEMETLGLSRGFPPLLQWLIEPIARRIGRRSVERSLEEFRTAVQARC